MGVQFRPLFGMRGLALSPLRARWQADYPNLQEQPALPPTFESGTPGAPMFQFSLSPVPSVRQLFLDDSGNHLVQVQQDRLIVNWRSGDSAAEYPRYGYIRDMFERRFNDLAAFVADEQLGVLEIMQTELTYINVIETSRENLGRADQFIAGWSGTPRHHLGEPEQTRATLVFQVPGVGHPPVRFYAEVTPAQRPNGELVLFFTLVLRGNPGGGSLAESLKFLDEAHEHIVRSFAELTKESMHEVWGRRT